MDPLARAHFYFQEKGRIGLAGLPPFQNRGHKVIPKDSKMIIFVSVNFKRLLKQKCNYQWSRLQLCPRCKEN
jgi:hypothetical protein